ncbi:MAG: NADH-quinone oxidoreductase subunit NuoE [Candidatus Cloacimonetes bacterium]|mgnify:FL=1|jgi:NADH-quinone oxidoreductase subunit E|nr:NADH-quinone oxidoreductase subunit NuoE [Candidatus Cloacimonadota bacterium]MBT6994655.1 NADH-quinone oxidoreductase subunit NuoE [Candidatus Cloacimonadota bacterium]MBT7469652.1 NADH-quinone oxidoreductase subunit NuoE [Candidatus Cloacimonadota bacterium]
MNNQKAIDGIIAKYNGKKGALIPLLQEVQEIDRYLSKDAMRYVSEKTDVKLAQIYGVATFYTMFRLKPQGKHIIRICKGTACHVSDANSILKQLRETLQLEGDEDTTKNGIFTLMEVACLGCCSLAPVMMINDDTFGKLVPESISEILKKYK